MDEKFYEYVDFKIKEIKINGSEIPQIRDIKDIDKDKEFFYKENDSPNSLIAFQFFYNDKLNLIEHKIEIEVFENCKNDDTANRFVFSFSFRPFFGIPFD